MKYYFIVLSTLFLYCCGTTKPPLFSANSEKFKNKYIEFIGNDEIPIASWYHYVKTKTTDNTYIVRTFFPETKQITSEVIYKDKSTKIAEGIAKYWHENGNLSKEGVYSNSKAIGLWKVYDRDSGTLSAKGIYENGLRNGIWEFYDSKGRLKKTINYIADKKDGGFQEYDSLQVIVNEGIYKSDTIFQQSKVDTLNQDVYEMPYLSEFKNIEDAKLRHKSTQNALLQYISENLKYPKNAKNYGIEGTTINQFTIDKDGSISDIEVIIGICQDFKDMNLKILSNMPKWEAGTQNGKKVKVSYTIPIKYKLEHW
ncbi:MAG: TonB family protein [Lewinellaceae bacterium]|nr:TonB family protein [Lewinellaceae bacterium]